MFPGLVIGLASFAEIVLASRSGELSRFLFDGGSPWPMAALIGFFLVVFSVAAPRVAAPAATLSATAFAWAAAGPGAPRAADSFLPLAALAAACTAAVCIALTRPPARTHQSATASSRRVRAALRAYNATA